MNEDIKNFIDENVVSNIVLKRYISATNEVELRRYGSFEKLVLLVREAFKIHWKGKNIEHVKSLDNITKDMNVPSRSGKNIASTLNIK
jgi:hypothetical protein